METPATGRTPEPAHAPREPSDAELLAATRRDPAQFAALYRRHVDAVLSYCVARLPEPQLAADITAETFAQALVSAGRFRTRLSPDGSSARPWLIGITKRLIWRAARSGQVESRARRRLGMQPIDLSHDDMERVVEMVDVKWQQQRLVRALDRLTPPLRQAVYLRVVEELPYEVIATRLGCSSGAARVRVSRALFQLAELLGVPEPADDDDIENGPEAAAAASPHRHVHNDHVCTQSGRRTE